MPVMTKKYQNPTELLEDLGKRHDLGEAAGRIADQYGQFFPKDKPIQELKFTDLARRIPKDRLEKILSNADLLKKERSWGHLTKGLALGGGLVAGGTLVNILTNTITDKVRDMHQERAFEEMMKLHPKLALLDRDRAHLFFDSLWTFAPDMAADPLVAGDVVFRAMQMDIGGGYPMETIKTVVEIQHKREDMRGGSAFGRGLSDFMSDAAKKQVIGIYGSGK